MNTLLGKKIEQSQMFLSDGTRIPVSKIGVFGNVVVGRKTKEKNNYDAITLGFGERKKARKSILGQVKGISLRSIPKFFKEARIEPQEEFKIGDVIKTSAMFKPGDIIDISGISKGKGFAGGVKRHHFRGGPRTHGQSDRERAPGSIGQTTTPGRVYRGKRMAGKMGHEKVTIKNLRIVAVADNYVYVKGLVPGPVNNLVILRKVGEDKKFVPLYVGETKEEVGAQTKTPETSKTEEVEKDAE